MITLLICLQLKRYKTYVYLLSSHMNSNNPADIINIIIGATTTPTPILPSVIISGGITNIVAEDEELKTQIPSPLSSGVITPIGEQPQQHHSTNRYSYRAAIYRGSDDDLDLG